MKEINHTEEREKDLQNLCNQVLIASVDKYHNPNGADESTCPFCCAVNYNIGCNVDIKDIEHTPDCAYNIAKGLLTNLR